MAIAISLQQYLNTHGIKYDTVSHRRTNCSRRTAKESHITESCLAKAVVIKCKEGYVLAIVPGSREVTLRGVGAMLNEPVCLATEQELTALFNYCKVGAVPPVGDAYGIRTIVDRSLLAEKHIYFEAGDHRTIIHLTGAEFDKLMKKVPHRNISREPRSSSSRDTTDSTAYWGA